MNTTCLKILLRASILLISTQLLAQNNAIETDLTAEITAHQAASIAQPFSLQQASKKVKIRHVQMSPNGQHLHYMTNEANGVALHLLDMKTETTRTLFHSSILKRANWSVDGNILFLQGASYLAYINPFEPDAKPQIFYHFDRQNEEHFYGINNSQPQQVLIRRTINTKNDSKPHQLVSMNKEGEETILYADKIEIFDFLFDESGQLTFIRQPDKQKHNIFLLTNSGKEHIFSCSVIDKCRMIKFDKSTNELFILGVDQYSFRSLFSLNIITKAVNLVHQDPEQIADLLSVHVDDATGEVIQLQYQSDRIRHYGLNEQWNNHYRLLESQLPGNLYISTRINGNHWLIKQTNAQLHHHKYFKYNLNSKKLTPILESHRLAGEPIAANQLAANLPISYLASDGMLLHGYVMLPSGRELSEVPLITSVHGGPFNRVKGGFSPVQYLVNQGFAIFQPNFRSSTGYGLQYMLAGKQKFSTRVQQDIVDGISYLLEQGIGDQQKLGVFGHSFGGYSVLSLLSSYPDLFVAGVATAPGTDLLDLLTTMDHKGINEYDGVPLKAALPILLADMENPKVMTQMKESSPRSNWHGINKPLLIWGGTKDERIPITHLRDFALKLKQSGQSIEFIEDTQTGHNPKSNDTITPKSMLYLIAEFFNRHINQAKTESDIDIDLYLKKHRVY